MFTDYWRGDHEYLANEHQISTQVIKIITMIYSESCRSNLVGRKQHKTEVRICLCVVQTPSVEYLYWKL